LGMVAFAFSVSTLTIAIPSIMADLSADVDRVQWVVTSFDMVQTVVMPTVGWLGGMLGNRNLFLTGIGISLQDIFILGGLLSVVTLLPVFFLPGRQHENAARLVAEKSSHATPQPDGRR